MAVEGKRALRTGQVNNAFANFRKLRLAAPHVTSPILDSSGLLLFDGKAKLARWKEYYSDLLIRPIADPPDDLTEAANSAVPDTSIDSEAPTESEVSKAIGKLRNGKAPRICGISDKL